MKTMKNALLILVLFVIAVPSVNAQNLDAYKLIAHYPLASNADEALGAYGAAELVNTPFRDGGVYCNGNYLYGDPDSCYVGIPHIGGLTPDNFIISTRFKVSEDDDKRRPVFVCGNSYRWLYVFIDNAEKLGFGVNDTYTYANNADIVVARDVWHTVAVKYDSVRGEACLYYDGAAVDTLAATIHHSDEKTLSITHSGTGHTFKGCLADVKFYAFDETANVAGQAINPRAFTLQQNYPNPFNPTTTIDFSIEKAGVYELALYSTTGRKIRTLVNDYLQAKTYSLMFTASDLASGIYICKLHGDGQSQVRRLVLLK